MTPTAAEAGQIRERERASWAISSSGWRAHDRELVAFSRPVSEELVRRAGIRPGMRVLDLASGTGEPSLTVAERVGPGGSVLGVDLVEEMLAVAREKARDRKLANVEYRAGDVEEAGLPPGHFDAATMRWGIMFVPDPVAAMRKVREALKPGARFALAVWGPPAENPFLRIPVDVLRRHTEVPTPPPGSPGLFAFGERERLSTDLAAAGFTGVETAAVPLHIREFRNGADYWKFTRAVGAPIRRLYDPLPPEVRARIDAEVAAEAERFAVSGVLDLPALSWVGWGIR